MDDVKIKPLLKLRQYNDKLIKLNKLVTDIKKNNFSDEQKKILDDKVSSDEKKDLIDNYKNTIKSNIKDIHNQVKDIDLLEVKLANYYNNLNQRGATGFLKKQYNINDKIPNNISKIKNVNKQIIEETQKYNTNIEMNKLNIKSNYYKYILYLLLAIYIVLLITFDWKYQQFIIFIVGIHFALLLIHIYILPYIYDIFKDSKKYLSDFLNY